MAYTLPQISDILLKSDRTMYRLGSIAYENMFSEDSEDVDYERDIIYVYKVAVEYADNFYVGTDKLDTVVAKLAAKIAVYDFGQLTPIYSDATIVTQSVPVGAALDDLSDVTITNVQNNQTLRYSSSLGQWINVGPGAAVRNRQQFTATLNQTVFVTTFPFESGLLDVYLNGVKLSPPSYTTFGNYTITLADGSLVDDIVEVIAYDPATSFIDLSGYVPTSRTLTINGVTYDLSANRTWTIDALPSQAGNTGKYLTTDGVIASWGAINLSGYVPYTGATATVDLGDNDLEAGSVFVEGASGAGGALRIKQFASSAANLDGYSTISTLNTGVFYFTAATTSPNFKNFVLNPSGLTDNTLRTYTLPNLDGTLALLSDITPGLTSVGLSMPSAFAVSNSPLTSNGTLAVTGAGTASQYVRGDGQLATLPSGAGGGSSVNYYLNGSINQGTIGGSVYYEMNRIPVIGTGTDFTRTNLQGDGLIAQFITDANDPNRLEIPAGAWNFEMYFNVSSAGGTPAFYLELLKYDGTTFTSIANGSTNPETITGGTAVDLYLSSLAVPQTTLLATDRLAIRVYVITSGRNITLHTEDNNLCEIITTFAGGVASLNGLTANTQYFATGTSGTDFAISSATDTHTFNLPTASATNRGALSSADWSTFSGKVGGSGASGQVAYWNGTSSQTGSNSLFWNNTLTNLGIGFNNINTAWKLGVAGNVAIEGFLSFGSVVGSASNAYIQVSSTELNIYAHTSRILSFYANAAERARITTGGNLLLNSTTDSGQRLQVQGTSFFSDSLGIGSTTLTGYGLRVSKTITGSIISGGIYNDGQVQSDVTSSVRIYRSQLNIVNSVFTISDVYHYIAEQGTIGASSSVTNQYGYITGNLTKGTNNYGFYGTISAATNRWNLYMAGTADNYLAGKLLIGTATVSTFALDVNGTARVSDALTVIKNQNLTTISNVTNTTSGNLSQSIFEAISSNGKCQFGKTSAGYSAFKTLLANDAYLYNVTSGNISILNDFSTGNINFAAGGVSTAQMTLTASGRLLLGTVSELTYVLDVNGGTARMNGSSTSRSGLEVGTMNHQFFATNNAFIAENAFYNGSAFQRVNTGFSSVAYFAGGGFQVGTLPSGSAGTTQASLNQRFFLTNSGTLAISDTISGGGNITLVASAVLQVDSTTKGFLPPRMTTTQKNAIGTPAAGLVVYDNTDNYLSLYNGTNWQNIVSPNSAGNVLIGTTADQGYRVQITSASADSQLNVWGATAPSIRLDNAASGATQRFVLGLATATNNFIQGASAGDVCITTATASPIVFGMWQTSTASEVMRITTSNNLLINKTADGGQKLQVSGKVNFASLPTSSAGLSAGDIWNNGGVLNIV